MKLYSKYCFLQIIAMLAWATVSLSITGCAKAASGNDLILSASQHTTALIVGDSWNMTFGLDPLDSKRHLQGTDSGSQQILKKYFHDITGQDAEILKASQMATPAERAKYQTRIWCDRQPEVDKALGDDLKNLDDDGFIIRANGNDLYLTGKNWWGTVYAAYELLERYAGCGFYGPGGKDSPFIIVPNSKKIEVPADINLVENPNFRSRWFRLAPAMTFRLRERDKFHHNFVNIIPPSVYAKTHPEYYPVIDGKRWIPPANRAFDFEPNGAAPGLVELVANTAIKYFDENPAAGSFSLGMNDSNKFCNSDACLADVPKNITDEKQRIAYSFLDFYNKIAAIVEKKYPDKRLGFLSYGTLRALPAGSIKLNPMLVPYVTLGTANLFDPDTVKGFQPMLDKWASLSQRMGVYEYAYGGGFVIPRIYNKYLISNIQKQYGANADGFYAEAYPNWGLDGPKYWLIAKMLWNNKQDPDALLNRYYTDMFGSAADAMKQYFDYLEEVWETQDVPGSKGAYFAFLDPIQLKIFTPQNCDHAWALLETAKTKTSDKEAIAHIKYFQDTFALTRTLVDSNTATDDATAAIPKKDAAATLETWLPNLLKAIQQWQGAPDLDATVATIKSLNPPALNDVTWQHLSMFVKQPISALQNTAQLLNQHAIDNLQKAGKPLTSANITQAVNALLDGYSKTYPDAVKKLQPVAEQGAMVIPTLTKAPTIDGNIQPDEWPKPVFDGHFYQFDSLEKQAEKSVVYSGWQNKTLYLACNFEQDPATVGGAFSGMDKGSWRKPEMFGDDAVVVNFFAPGFYMQSIRVNANGAIGLVDNQPNSDRLQNAVQAKVTKTTTGWQVEMAIDMTKLQVPSPWLNKETLLLPIARYTRRALPHKSNEPVKYSVDVSASMPIPGGARSYGGGNFTSLMSFINGPQLIFGN